MAKLEFRLDMGPAGVYICRMYNIGQYLTYACVYIVIVVLL